MTNAIHIRPVHANDYTRLEDIRQAAFAPVFASFHQILGAEISDIVHRNNDAEQAQYLASILAPNSEWELHVATQDDLVIGFVSIQINHTTTVGEIGLNAVHPDWSGAGIGTTLYTFALDRMRAAGMRAATVSTGGDDSHAPARRAYQKAGFAVGIPSIWYCQEL
ncbi:MAG: GNAT family N-acetyltransferase [Roseiflexaceae bacterium]